MDHLFACMTVLCSTNNFDSGSTSDQISEVNNQQWQIQDFIDRGHQPQGEGASLLFG